MSQGPWQKFDKEWFRKWNYLLVRAFATPLLGKWLRRRLCIRKEDIGYYKKIVQITPNSYTVDNLDSTYTVDFRTHWKFSKRVYQCFKAGWWSMHWWDQLVANPIWPAWNLGYDTLTSYPDDDAHLSTSSALTVGTILGGGPSWATLRNHAGNVASGSGNTEVEPYHIENDSGNYKILYRGIFLFDTSTLGSGALISAAVMSLYGNSKEDPGGISPDVDIYTSAPSSNTALVSTDYSTIGSTSQTGAPVAYSSQATGAYQAFTFNSTGRGNISTTGVSKFAARNANYDAANSGPTLSGSDYCRWKVASANETGTSKDPKLVVTYAPAQTLTLPFLSSGVSLYAPAVAQGFSLPFLSSGTQLYTPTIIAQQAITTAFRSSTVQLYTPTIERTNPPNLPYVQMMFDGVTWTSVMDDLVAAASAIFKRGKAGGGPKDLMAITGTGRFTLRSSPDALKPSRPRGYYWWGSTNCRSGFMKGTPVRLMHTLDGEEVPLWTGKVDEVNPDTGYYGPGNVQVMCVDIFNDLSTTDVQSVTAQVDKTEVELVQAVFAELPAESQPSSVDYDDSLDTLEYAFYDASSGVKATTILQNVANGSRFSLFSIGDGSIKMLNRQASQLEPVMFTFEEKDTFLKIPSGLSSTFNRVVGKVHLLTIDASPIVVASFDSILQIEPSETIERFLDYRDPTNPQQLIGAIDPEVPIVATTDYKANTAQDGSGSVITADLDADVTAFAASAKFLLTNNNGSTMYVVDATGAAFLQLRARGVHDNGPTYIISSSTQPYGVRQLDLDMGYNQDLNSIQDMLSFIERQYRNQSENISSITFNPQRASELLEQAIRGEIGNVVEASDSQNGMVNVNALIQGIEYEVKEKKLMRTTYITAPRPAFSSFIFDDPVHGEFDNTEALFGYN